MKKLKKIILICFAILLCSTAAVTGTLAYETLSAQEWAEQTGETVAVQLVKQQRRYDDAGNLTGLEDYQPLEILVPLHQSAQYDGTNFDHYGMPMADGYVDQIVRVKNTGTADAWVRVIVAIPAALDDANDAGHNALHWNLGNRFRPNGDFSSQLPLNEAFKNVSWGFSKTAVVDGVRCNLYTFTYNERLPAGQTTDAAAFVGFYLDKNVNIEDGHLILDGEDTGFTDSEVKIHISAQAVQTYGVDSAEEAFKQANDNPWNK